MPGNKENVQLIDTSSLTKGQAAIKDQQTTMIEIGYVASTRYEDKLSTRFDQHELLCSLLRLDTLEGHDRAWLAWCADLNDHTRHITIRHCIWVFSKGDDSTWRFQNQSDDLSKKTQWLC